MRKSFLFSILILFFLLLTFCSKKDTANGDESAYLNQNDTVQYVGMETCRLCHINQHATFIHTGMGMSFDKATRQKSAGIFDEHAIVFDTLNNLYYKPFWQNDTLKIMEFRLANADTIHKRIESVSYIIGSGQHTNSHLININGYVYQAPITFYTQKKQWDMAPGMEQGFNSRFSRIIETECMNCHNGLPELVAGSINKYQTIPSGIDCERCHGPGSLHVARVSNNQLVDTANAIDYSIVNPKKLSIHLQNQLCDRCHLQGVNVLNEGASYFDFKPGDNISDHWNIFLPEFDGTNTKFLMASQADRLMQSKCFISSQKISCITCHNPHVSVKDTPIAQFNNACKTCHTPLVNYCTETEVIRLAQDDNCSGCHIPKSGAIDIPHVSISDHKIQIPNKEKTSSSGNFLGLKCMTDQNPTPLTMAKGYLHYYEAFNNEKMLLDSVKWYLNKVKTKDDDYNKTLIHLYFIQAKYSDIIATSKNLKNSASDDMWASYRIGEAYLNTEQYPQAVEYFAKAVKLQPFNLDNNFKLATAQLFSGNLDLAEKGYQFVLKENPEYYLAWNNLGVLQMNSGKLKEAENSFLKTIALDPDYLNAKIKLAELYISTRQKNKATQIIEQLKQNYPDEPAVNQLLLKVRSI